MKVTVKLEETDRNWLERLKRRNNFKSLTETLTAIRKVFQTFKLEKEINDLKTKTL